MCPAIRTAEEPAVTVALPTITLPGAPVAKLGDCVGRAGDVDIELGDALLEFGPSGESGFSGPSGLDVGFKPWLSLGAAGLGLGSGTRAGVVES